MRTIIFIFLASVNFQMFGQTTIDFESFSISVDNALNGQSVNGGFQADVIFLPNVYDPAYDFWSGWSISSFTDKTTPGYSNQYSAIVGSGVGGSKNYATSFVLEETKIIINNNESNLILGLYVTNGTYPFFSIRDGDAFAKKFGGETGNDPDFFLLTIKSYLNDDLSQDSINFYLADFRFSDNSQDYIVDDWRYVDLSSFGMADSLSFSLSSSDVGFFGMNTPAYFCIDNVITDQKSTINIHEHQLNLSIFPNPVNNELTIEFSSLKKREIYISNQLGKIMYSDEVKNESVHIDTHDLIDGFYFIKIIEGESNYNYTFVKSKI